MEIWNDFKLRDSLDIAETRFPMDGARGAECIEVQLPQAKDIESIVLYDHPDELSNILAGYAELPDGTQVPFGPLSSTGTQVLIPNQPLAAFRIYITETEGPAPGLTEIEAYSDASCERSIDLSILSN